MVIIYNSHLQQLFIGSSLFKLRVEHSVFFNTAHNLLSQRYTCLRKLMMYTSAKFNAAFERHKFGVWDKSLEVERRHALRKRLGLQRTRGPA